jgi:hypothetical protein
MTWLDNRIRILSVDDHPVLRQTLGSVGPKSPRTITRALSCGMTWCSTLTTEHYANWAGATTQVPNDSFNEYMPIKKVSMQATDDRKQRA